MQVLAHNELKSAHERRFERRDIHLAIALSGMAVAHLEQSAACLDRNIERSSGDHLLVIEIAGMKPGWSAADAAGGFGRRYTHASEKGTQRNLDAIGEARHHALAVQGDDFEPRIRKFIGQESGPGAKSVIGVWNGEPDG